MNGWKTYTAAAVSMAYGVAGIFLGLHDASDGMQFVVQGMGLMGIGHKLVKLKDDKADG